jgi:hypothetical protein
MEQKTRSEYTLTDDEIKEAMYKYFRDKFAERGATIAMFTKEDIVMSEMPNVSLVITTTREI